MSAAGGAMTKGGAVVPGFDCVMYDAYLPFQWPKEAGRHEFILETPPHWDGGLLNNSHPNAPRTTRVTFHAPPGPPGQNKIRRKPTEVLDGQILSFP